MVKPQLGHDQVVLEYRWSLNTGGRKSRFHCITVQLCMEIISYVLFPMQWICYEHRPHGQCVHLHTGHSDTLLWNDGAPCRL